MRTRFLALSLFLSIGLAACGSNTAKNDPQQQDEIAANGDPAESQALEALPPPDPVGNYWSSQVVGDYAGYADTQALISRMESEQGFDREYLYGLFSRVERQQWILDYLNRPKYKGKPRPGSWNRYRKKFLTDTRIRKGQEFWRDHYATLARAEAEYGVPAEYIVSIIGVETNYGRNFGSHKVIEALSTLAFDYPRRSEFFTSELEHYLVMARQEGWDPMIPVGSYAGAMGLGQFMPSSFHNYAVDFDGDGRRDLWNPVDAIGSVANYFAGHGWRTGDPVVYPAQAYGNTPELMDVGFSSRYYPETLRQSGIVVSSPLDGTEQVSLLRFSTYSGPEYYIGLNNFYVITRYNHSSYYAMAVHQLAEVLARTGRPSGGPVLSLEIGGQLPVN